VRPDHPLRPIRRMTDEVLATLSPRFDRMYSDVGRPSIPPEQLLRALLLQSLYTHASVDYRPRRAARTRGQAIVCWPRVARQSPWPGRQCVRDGGDRYC